jgi:polyisoprenoid-binding protein YceI
MAMVAKEQSQALIGEWTLVQPLASVSYEVGYVVGSYKGQFRELRATLQVGADGKASLEGAAVVASVDAKDAKMLEHLLADDFFDAANHPELTFAAQGIDIGGQELAFPGELAIKGITQTVQLTGSASGVNPGPGGTDFLGLQLSTSFDRHDFELRWNVELLNGLFALANDVTVHADLFFRRAS